MIGIVRPGTGGLMCYESTVMISHTNVDFVKVNLKGPGALKCKKPVSDQR